MAISIGAIIGLAQYVPDLIGLFNPKRGKQAKDAIDAVGKVAESVTGKSGDDAIAAISQNPDLALEFKMAVMADSHIQDQMELEDKKSAREAYKVHHQQADKIADRIMTINVPVLLVLAILQVCVIYFAQRFDLSVEIVAIVSNILGIIIKSLLDERLAVTGFFFGSSLGSKTKDLNR